MIRARHGSGLGRSRRQTALLIVAMLCVRAFIPAGFMAAPVDGRWQLVVCSPGALGSADTRNTILAINTSTTIRTARSSA